jgi:hypothetical protein
LRYGIEVKPVVGLKFELPDRSSGKNDFFKTAGFHTGIIVITVTARTNGYGIGKERCIEGAIIKSPMVLGKSSYYVSRSSRRFFAGRQKNVIVIIKRCGKIAGVRKHFNDAAQKSPGAAWLSEVYSL